jgi:hypothetical protein
MGLLYLFTLLDMRENLEVSKIQGDSGGKINILGGDEIGHCEKKSSYEHVSNSEWLPTYSCLNLQT